MLFRFLQVRVQDLYGLINDFGVNALPSAYTFFENTVTAFKKLIRSSSIIIKRNYIGNFLILTWMNSATALGY